jgi:hypothetical protein
VQPEPIVTSTYAANMNALLQADIYIYVVCDRQSLAVLVASAACSSNSVTVCCVVSQLLLQTICSFDLFAAIDLVVALDFVVTPGLSIQPCLCLYSALVVNPRQQSSGVDGGSVGILQRQKREKVASWML